MQQIKLEKASKMVVFSEWWDKFENQWLTPVGTFVFAVCGLLYIILSMTDRVKAIDLGTYLTVPFIVLGVLIIYFNIKKYGIKQ